MESLNSTLPSTFNIPVAYLKNYSQQLMKIWGDKTDTLNPNDLLRFKLPNTVIDLKTLNFIFEFTTSAVGSKTSVYQNRYFPYHLPFSVQLQFILMVFSLIIVKIITSFLLHFTMPNLLLLLPQFIIKKLTTPHLNLLLMLPEPLPTLFKVFQQVQAMIVILLANFQFVLGLVSSVP